MNHRAPDFVRAAADELRESAAFYEARRQGLGLRFLGAVEQTLQHVIEEPLLGSELGGAIRRRAVDGFPFTLIYRANVVPIRVLAVAHVRRRPGYWRGRR